MTIDNDELEPETPKGESDEDLDTEKGGDAGPEPKGDAPKGDKGGNRFSELGSRLSDRMARAESDDDDEDDLDDDLDDDGDRDAEGEDDGESDRKKGKTPSTDTGKPKGETKQGAKEKEKEDDDGDEDGEPGSSRFEVVDEEGSKYELDLPAGAKIKFPADGKTVTVDSIDKLVQMAQKGEAFDRVTSRIGSRLGTAQQQLTELKEDAEADRELVKALVNGTIDADELTKLEKLFAAEEEDPDARDAKKALEEKRERETEDTEGAKEEHVKATREFWTATDARITETLPTFPYLDAEDAAEIQTRFHQAYIDRRAALVEEFVKIAPQHGVSEADAVREADQRAITESLNRKTLRRVMQDLNDKYAKRAGKGGDGKKERTERREAERHNRQIEARRASSRDPANRSLRSGGSQVNTREPRRERDEPKGFEAKLERSLSRFHRIRTSADDDDDE